MHYQHERNHQGLGNRLIIEFHSPGWFFKTDIMRFPFPQNATNITYITTAYTPYPAPAPPS